MSLSGNKGDSKKGDSKEVDERSLTRVQLGLTVHGRTAVLKWRSAEMVNSRFGYLPLLFEDKTPGAPEQYQYKSVAVVDFSKVKKNEQNKIGKKESEPVTLRLTILM